MQLFACKLPKDWFAIRTKNGKSSFWGFFKIWFGKYSGMLTSVDWWELQKNFSHDLWISLSKCQHYLQIEVPNSDFWISSVFKSQTSKKVVKLCLRFWKQCRFPVNLTNFLKKKIKFKFGVNLRFSFFEQLVICQIN